MLSINTNLSSLIAQSSMQSSTQLLSQAVERMSTGYKINHAKDNAANYSIATNMTTKIGALQVAEDNAMQGLEMVGTASQNLNLIYDKLQRLRALAVQSSNGSYGSQSLQAINTEVNALVDEIDRTYSSTEYNGQKVFKSVAPIEIPDGIGATGNVGVQTPTTYSMRATNYGDFLDNPYTYEQTYVDNLTAVSEVVEADGFTETEYKIATVDDLVALANLSIADVDTTGITFVLAKDIDLGAYCDAEIMNGNGGWTPIKNFKGIFDGNGHVITNLKINRTTGKYQGLFDYTISGSEIKNLGLNQVSVKGQKFIGALAGQSYSNITNCYVFGEIVGTSEHAGGLVGYANSTIDYCYTTTSVEGKSHVGGLVGYGYSTCSITNSHTTGNISGKDVVGGVVGNSYAAISDCYSTANVTGTTSVGGLAGVTSGKYPKNSYATGNVEGTTNVGGLVGSGSCSNSYAIGNVTGTTNVGGLVGSGSCSNSYAIGNVTGTTNVGGLVGSLDPWSTISDSSSTGNVTGATNVGGLVGYAERNITNCYSTGVVIGATNVGGLVGQVKKTSGTVNITNCLSYSMVSGNNSDSNGGLIGGAVVTADNVTFGTVNITGCQSMSQGLNIIGGSYMYDSITYTLLDTYDMSAMIAGVSLYVPEVTSLTLQVGANAPNSNQITFDMAFMLENINNLRQIGLQTVNDSISLCDELIATVSEKQTLYGAIENRIISALDEISTQYENLVSSRSTIRDADISEESATYIQQQILQQAAATLMSTANQAPAIALQLI